MTALVKYTDVAMVQSSETWDDAGTNYKDNRCTWFNINDESVTFSDGAFTEPSGTKVTLSDWTEDTGALSMPANQQEIRNFCLHGVVTFTFTGPTLVLRINTDYGFGTGFPVYIDGVQPSTITGIITGNNTVSCDSETYGLEGPANLDILIADGLANTTHTCSIYVKSSGNLYFAMVGYKVYSFTSKSLVQSAWIVPASLKLGQNQQTLSLVNKGGTAILNATLSYPTSLVDQNANALAATVLPLLQSTTTDSQTIMPAYTGAEVSGAYTYPMTLSALYPDPAGTITQSYNGSIVAASTAMVIGGSTWTIDQGGVNGGTRLFSNALGIAANYISFSFSGASVTITVEQDSGWGIFDVYDGNNNLMGTITCNNANANQNFTATISGFPPSGTNTCVLRQSSATAKKYVVFVSATWVGNNTYTQITETVDLVVNAQQPYAMPVEGVTQGTYTLNYTAPITGEEDFTDPVVRLNENIAYTEILERFPTYAVCYEPGYADLLSAYDILIVDPFAAEAADVIAWQAKGIKVFGYISLGEEDSFFVNRYDFNSGQGPWPGDGNGPGGYASYYLKGGYQSRECTECSFDNQALLGQKTCAKSQPMYFQPTGRCSAACHNDSLNGYTTWSAGGKCAAGYTSSNNWQRPDADTCCTNSSCPKYTPVHSLQTGTACPKYEQVDSGYLQDYSIATPTFPDQNGVWDAYYTDAGNPTWMARIMSYYASTCLNGPVTVTKETVTVLATTISTGAAFSFNTALFPVDDVATITLTTLDGTTGVYIANQDYSFDMKTGAFTFNDGITPAVVAGQQLLISYVKKGHHMDGIFMDTIDDADVYPGMGDLMSQLVINLKANTNTKLISNRGFTNLSNYIQACDGVMFESWLSDWDEDTGDYFLLTDSDDIEFTNAANEQLRQLRMKHVFDVYSLNYCNADSSGDPIRLYCAEEDRKKGYLSWTSTIDLDIPAPNMNTPTPDQRIQGTAFKRFRLKSY